MSKALLLKIKVNAPKRGCCELSVLNFFILPSWCAESASLSEQLYPLFLGIDDFEEAIL